MTKKEEEFLFGDFGKDEEPIVMPVWQGLTDDEISRLIVINEVDNSGDIGFVRLIETALKEKNS